MPKYSGRVSVPVLWDKKRKTIVNNESPEIIRMLNSAFDKFTNVHTDYYPPPLRAEIDCLNDKIYSNVNNGVYRAGFATSQAAYEKAFRGLFDTLDEMEQLLSQRRYLAGNAITEADWRFFTTLIRFDAVYYSHFKCNWRHIYEYPNLSNYTRDLYQQPGVAETVSLDADQAALLFQPATGQSDRHRSGRPAIGFCRAARSGEVWLKLFDFQTAGCAIPPRLREGWRARSASRVGFVLD